MSLNSSGGRKAAIQVQFTWIFALVAGAVILLFFVTFILKQKDITEMTFCSDAVTHLTTVLVSAQASLGTTNNISIPKLDIQFDCTGYNLPECREPFGNTIIFSPERIKGHALITYTLGWDMPYRSANILYLTQPEARYIFFNDVKEVYDMMPDAVSKEIVSSSEAATLKKQNSPHVRVVVEHGNSILDNFDIGALNSLDDDVLSVIGIKRPSIASETAEVTFFEKTDGTTFEPIEPTFTVIGEEMLLGAVFSGNHEMFECMLQRALERYQYVTEVYLYRATKLKSAALTKTCTDRYGDAETHLTALYGDIVDYSNSGLSGGIPEHIRAISDINDRLKLFSCPTLY